MTRICVYGAGSVGGFLAATLARAGRDVRVIARGPHLAAIRERGLTLRGDADTFTVRPPASDDPFDFGPQDLVVVAAKTPALPGVARGVAPLLGPNTLVAFAVNGVYWFYAHRFAPRGVAPDARRLDPGGVLRDRIGPERALGIVVRSSNEVTEPGVVVNTGRNGFAVGDATPGETGRAERVAAALAAPGMDVVATADLRREMWRKLVRNVGSSPLCSLTGADSRAAFADPGLRALSEALMRETLAVAAAHGFGGMDDAAAEPPGGRLPVKPSMLQDLERGRPMEIDTQIAIVRDFGRGTGVPTPALDAVLPLLALRARVAGCYDGDAA